MGDAAQTLVEGRSTLLPATVETPRRRTGRPPRLTPEVHKAICESVRLGVPLRLAALRVGVKESTAREWVARGRGRHCRRASNRAFAEFAADYQRALAESVRWHVGQIVQASRGGEILAERTVTRTRKDGTVETTREVRYTVPKWRASAWMLQRICPEFRLPPR